MIFFPFELEEVVEGSTRLYVPSERTRSGPGKRAPGFYNEAMSINRDLAVLVVESLSKTCTVRFKVLDGLAATGAMGVRLANEVRGLECVINDRNELAFQLIKKNIELNGLGPDRARAENCDLRAVLDESEFDYVDIDPYGSPAPFLDDAFKAVTKTRHMGITATDKAPLCGVYPRACRRKYGSSPIKTQYSDEIGLRILVGRCARTALKHKLVIKPLLSYSYQHHFRVYLKVERDNDQTSVTMDMIGYVNHDEATGERLTSSSVLEGYLSAGPLWIGPLIDPDFIADLRYRLNTDPVIRKLLELWKEEAKAPSLFYTTDEVSKRFGLSPPPMARVLEALRSGGYNACRTHFSPTGFKTDASMKDIERLFRT